MHHRTFRFNVVPAPTRRGMGELTAMFLAAVITLVVAALVFVVVFSVPAARATEEDGGQAPRPSLNIAAALDPSLVAQGKVLFSKSCIMCHTAQGDAVPGLGATIRQSPLVLDGTLDEVAAYIKVGSTPGNPGNKSGLAMPPNPSLTPAQLQALASYCKTLATGR